MKAEVLLRIVSADISRVLSAIVQAHIIVYDIEPVSELEIHVRIPGRYLKKTVTILERKNAQWSILKKKDLFTQLKKLRRRWVLLICLVFLLVFTIFLPTKVLFIEIVGNQKVPDRRILETAKDAGLFVGTDRSYIRSEQIKNHLLEAIPELSWAGINTEGCLATIRVHESENETQEEPPQVSHIVAVCDGIIESCVVTQGRGLCKTGDAVKKGQLLVSGYSDHQFIITATRSCAEIIAKTTRKTEGVILLDGHIRTEAVKEAKNISLIIDQKEYPLIKQMEDICDSIYGEKYVTITQLTLPGQMVLPIWLRVETYVIYDIASGLFPQEEAVNTLKTYCADSIKESMVGGQILSCSEKIEYADYYVCYVGCYECLEMIGQEIKAEPYQVSQNGP